jgi:hypothetical protein
MPLFVCEKCGTIDNTAMDGTFWYSRAFLKESFEQFPKDLRTELALCTECQTGKWHDEFDKEKATPERVKELGVENFMKDGLKFLNMKGEI